jgi:hypothetical protein
MPAANWVRTGNKYYFKIGNGKQMGSKRMTWRNNVYDTNKYEEQVARPSKLFDLEVDFSRKLQKLNKILMHKRVT